MKKTARSLGYSLAGLKHAVQSERNLQLFLAAQVVVILISLWLGVDIVSLTIMIVFGLGFLIVELVNTAIERLADTVDDEQKKERSGHYHLGIKQTKDVAAAASLIALLVDGCVVILMLLPYALRAYYMGL